jgi:hypothetical protein
VKESIIFTTDENTPFTIVANVFSVLNKEFEFMIEVVAVTPFTADERVFVVEMREFDIGIEEVGIVREALVRFRFPVMTVLPESVVDADKREEVFVVEALRLRVLVVEAVIVVAKRLVK